MKNNLSPEILAELDIAWKLFEWNGTVRLTAKRGDFDVTGGVLKSKADLYRAAHNLEEGGWDVYIGANPARGTRIKAATREVEVWRYVVLDLDPIDPECAPELALSEGIRSIPEMADINTACVIVFTGRGAQGWIALHPSHLHGADDRALVERGMGHLLHNLKRKWDGRYGYEIDTSTSDLARIVRCPGTINTKTGKRAKVIRLAAGQMDPQPILDSAPPPPEPTKPLDVDCSNLNQVAPHLNDRARKFLRMGIERGERHKSAFAAAMNLRELGIERATIVAWVVRGGDKCRPRLNFGDCVHAVEEAFKREVRSA